MTARSKLYLKGDVEEFWLLGDLDLIVKRIAKGREESSMYPFIRLEQVPYLPGEDAKPVYLDPHEVAAVLPLDDREYEYGLEERPDWLRS